MGLNDLLAIIQNLRESATNLEHDVDEKHPREETKKDLQNVVTNFSQLRTLIAQMDQSDMDAIQGEVMELISGKETFEEYVRDVNAILHKVQAKAASSPAVKEKLTQNLPAEAKGKPVDQVLGGYGDVFKQISGWIDTYQKLTR